MRIVLLHGALGAADQITPLAIELQKEGFQPEVLELPGHGKTPLNGVDFSINGFAEWLKEETSRRDLQNMPFFGFSMGGYIALYLSSKEDIPAKEIITLGTSFNWSPETAAREVKKLNPDKILEKVPKFAQMLDERHDDWKAILKNTETLMTKLGNEPLFGETEAANVANRVLIMRGEGDQMVSQDESGQVAQWLPNGSYKELTAIPHPLEQVPPSQIAVEIKKFLNG